MRLRGGHRVAAMQALETCLEEALARVQEPTWDDTYLLALATRAKGADGWPTIVEALRTADGLDPRRRERLDTAFPAA